MASSAWSSRPEDPGPQTPWIRLEPDAVAMVTRDYLAHPTTDRRAVWSIEAEDPPATFRLDDAELARRFRAALTWVRDQSAMVPLTMGQPNTMDPPYPVPTTTFGWAAGDAAYAMGTYDLRDDQALVLRGRSPECVFWNICLWNPFLHTYNYDYERVTLNGAEDAVRTGRLLGHRRLADRSRPPELGLDRRAPPGMDLVPMVPARADTRADLGRGRAGGTR